MKEWIKVPHVFVPPETPSRTLRSPEAHLCEHTCPHIDDPLRATKALLHHGLAAGTLLLRQVRHTHSVAKLLGRYRCAGLQVRVQLRI